MDWCNRIEGCERVFDVIIGVASGDVSVENSYTINVSVKLKENKKWFHWNDESKKKELVLFDLQPLYF